MDDLAGKIAVVTGGGSGIGRATSLALARGGADVVVTDINLSNAEKVGVEVKSLGRRCLTVKHNIADSSSSASMVDEVIGEFSGIDILVNNAGVGPRPSPFHELSEEEWDRVMDINAKGTFLVSRAVTPGMIRQGSGRIVNVSSVVGKEAYPNVLHYCASKFALIGMTQGMAKELGAYDITVNAVCPGVVRTPLHEGAVEGMSKLGAGDVDEVWAHFVSLMSLGRIQDAEDVAEMISFLASDRAKNITGSAFNVAGGMEMR